MANNRYYLYCPVCHGKRWFGKSLAGFRACPDHDVDYTLCGQGIELEVYNYDRVTLRDFYHFLGVHIMCHEESEWHDGTFIEVISEYDPRMELEDEDSIRVHFTHDRVTDEEST